MPNSPTKTCAARRCRCRSQNSLEARSNCQADLQTASPRGQKVSRAKKPGLNGGRSSFVFGSTLTGDVALSFVRVRLLPQLSGGAQRVDLKCLPPGHFVSRLMQLPMMAAAERYCELIAHLDPQSARLCKTQVMRIAGVPSANSTRLRRDEAKVGLVPTTFWFG